MTGSLSATLLRIERSAGALSTASVARMDEVLPWFREVPADQRAWVTLVAQAGVRSLVEWLRRQDEQPGTASQEVSDEVFDAAPRALTRSINLEHTVQLIKVTIDVVEEQVPHLAEPGQEGQLREAVVRFSREVAFAAARVYARAAETRGLWDARLQAPARRRPAPRRGVGCHSEPRGGAGLVGLGIGGGGRGPVPRWRRRCHHSQRLSRGPPSGRRGDRRRARRPADRRARRCHRRDRRHRRRCWRAFGDGPVVVSASVPTLDEAIPAARAAVAGYRAAPAWPAAPRPVLADDLLPERTLAGDVEARRALRQVYAAAGAARRRAGGDAGRVLRGRRGAGERGSGPVCASEHCSVSIETYRGDNRFRTINTPRCVCAACGARHRADESQGRSRARLAEPYKRFGWVSWTTAST